MKAQKDFLKSLNHLFSSTLKSVSCDSKRVTYKLTKVHNIYMYKRSLLNTNLQDSLIAILKYQMEYDYSTVLLSIERY